MNPFPRDSSWAGHTVLRDALLLYVATNPFMYILPSDYFFQEVTSASPRSG